LTLLVESLGAIRLARYEFLVRARDGVVLPPFLGSTLRGAFGHALKESVCVMSHRDCSRCFLAEWCLYPRLFEPEARNGEGLLAKRQDAPRPFIFIPPLPSTDSGLMRARDDLLRWRVRVKAGESVVFGLSLVGEAIQELPYIIHAIRMMAQNGFGAERTSFQLERVSALNYQGEREVVFTSETTRIREHDKYHANLGVLTQARIFQLATEKVPERTLAATAGALTAGVAVPSAKRMTRTSEDHASAARVAIPDARSLAGSSIGSWQSAIGNEITLRFITPTRLRIKGEVVENPSFVQLISSLSLRLAMVAQTYGTESLSYDHKAVIERARNVSTRNSTLRLMALDRFSSRRKTKLAIDGFMGDVTFSGAATQELLPLIVAGEFLHVGSGTAFGMGRYVIVS
jgi:CRISPR/Cas system endoribonuclease Cas6 (RAMP superfamily)